MSATLIPVFWLQNSSLKYPPLPKSVQGTKRFDEALENYPDREMWRFWMDPGDWIHEEFHYDKKNRGYRAAMLQTQRFLRNTTGASINFTFLSDLHDHVVRNVYEKDGTLRKYRNTSRGFGPPCVAQAQRRTSCSPQMLVLDHSASRAAGGALVHASF